MFLQQHMRLPIDSEIPQSHIIDEEDDKGSNIDKTVTSLLQSRDPEEAFRKAEQNTNESKETYDQKDL